MGADPTFQLNIHHLKCHISGAEILGYNPCKLVFILNRPIHIYWETSPHDGAAIPNLPSERAANSWNWRKNRNATWPLIYSWRENVPF